jgi:hypothetical protein
LLLRLFPITASSHEGGKVVVVVDDVVVLVVDVDELDVVVVVGIVPFR